MITTMTRPMRNLRKLVHPRAFLLARDSEKSLRASDVILGMLLVMFFVLLAAVLLTRLSAAF